MDNVPYLFPIAEYWWFYGLFLVFVLAMLALDLGVFHRKAHEVSIKEALGWSITWVTLALLFCFGFWQYALWKFPNYSPLVEYLTAQGLSGQELIQGTRFYANDVALKFLTGFIVEKSLSVDNIFVFIIVFNYFAIPRKYQHRVLFYGILGALIFRTIFIALGAFLMQFHWIIWVFGAFLIFTGVKILFGAEQKVDPEKNFVIRILRRFLRVTPLLEGQRFFVHKERLLYATPLFVCLAFIEASDIVFAVDSVPAIFAITKEPLIVFTSNIFAILGLRAMFFLLAGIMHRFHLLQYGLGIILIFVGLKMVWLTPMMGGEFPVTWSLGIICGILTLSVVASLVFPKKETTSDMTE